MKPIVLSAASGSLHRLPAHTNPGLEVVYLERGNLIWQIEGREYQVPAGSVFFTMPWESHGSAREFEPGHRWHFAIFPVGTARNHRSRKLDPGPVFGAHSRTGRQVLKTLAAAPARCLPCSERLAFLIRGVIAETSSSLAWSHDVLTSLARGCLLELARCVLEDIRPKRNGSVPWRVRNFLQTLPGRTGQAWSLADMAAECRLGRTHFANLVKILTGDSPLDHLRRLRIECARALLINSELTVTEIAMACGFASSQHFARVFKSFTGTAASAYRREKAFRRDAGDAEQRTLKKARKHKRMRVTVESSGFRK